MLASRTLAIDDVPASPPAIVSSMRPRCCSPSTASVRVSLREINRAAGAKNAVAVQYHFGDRAGILRAINAKHFPAIDARRHAHARRVRSARQRRHPRAAPRRGCVRWPRSSTTATAASPTCRSTRSSRTCRRRVDAAQRTRARRSTAIQRWRVLVEPFLPTTRRACTAATQSCGSPRRKSVAGRGQDRTATTDCS